MEVLSLISTMADRQVAEQMGLDLGCQLMRLERLLVQGDRPVGHVLTGLMAVSITI